MYQNAQSVALKRPTYAGDVRVLQPKSVSRQQSRWWCPRMLSLPAGRGAWIPAGVAMWQGFSVAGPCRPSTGEQMAHRTAARVLLLQVASQLNIGSHPCMHATVAGPVANDSLSCAAISGCSVQDYAWLVLILCVLSLQCCGAGTSSSSCCSGRLTPKAAHWHVSTTRAAAGDASRTEEAL
jgi:hypothetical protein